MLYDECIFVAEVYDMDDKIFLEDDYIKEEKIINIIWANIFGIIVLLISSLIFGLPFYLLWIKDIGKIIIDNPMMRLQERIIMTNKNVVFITEGCIKRLIIFMTANRITCQTDAGRNTAL